ncbi:hypothetical protein TNCV_109061 [Trichonephila clavipes]|nr:hypothetical protein TNCV_109061 [Trichonephila clavipes]
MYRAISLTTHPTLLANKRCGHDVMQRNGPYRVSSPRCMPICMSWIWQKRHTVALNEGFLLFVATLGRESLHCPLVQNEEHSRDAMSPRKWEN